MRACVLVWGIIMILSLTLGCRKRSEILMDPWRTETDRDAGDEQPVIDAEPRDADATEEGMKEPSEPSNTAAMDAMPAPDRQAEPARKPEFSLIKFAHADNLCLEAGSDGRTSLQTCSPASDGGKFLAAAALDGRIQFQNIKSKLCLTSGGDRFTGFVLQMETCSSKSSQFFTRIEFDKVFALRQDNENRCIYAENGAKTPGSRVVMFPCANDMAQRLVP